MKKTSKILIILMVMILGGSKSFGQVIVKVKPNRPAVHAVRRPPAPSPNHTWVEEDWIPRGNSYVWHGGYWVAAPRKGAKFVTGYWRNSRRGMVWVPGHWK